MLACPGCDARHPVPPAVGAERCGWCDHPLGDGPGPERRWYGPRPAADDGDAPAIGDVTWNLSDDTSGDDDAALPGRVGRYEVLGVLGQGGMGVVYLARDPALGRRVAIKTLVPGASGRGAVTRFLREARTQAALTDPGIVRILDIGETADGAYACMELVEGPSLAAVLRERTTLPEAEAVRIVRQVARALHAAHDAGLVHRDIKPGNILLQPDGTPLLADFGLARREDASDRLTKTGAILGTPRYMAPEQATGGVVDRRSDVYALGVVLYECLCGRIPYDATGPTEMLVQIASAPPLRLDRVRRDLPADLVTVVHHALQRAPADRYPSAAALARDLEAVAERAPIQARRPTLVQRVRHWARQERGLLRGAGLALAVVVVGGAGAWGAQQALEARAAAAHEAEAASRAAALLPRLAEAPTEADALVAPFLERFGGTDAALALRVAHAAALRREDRAAPARAVLAEAYRGATSDAQRDQVLRALALGYRDDGAWENVDALLARIGADGPVTAGLRAQAEAARGDLAAADTPGAPRWLARAARLPARAELSARLDVDGDGRDEIVLVHDRRARVHGLPALTPVAGAPVVALAAGPRATVARLPRGPGRPDALLTYADDVGSKSGMTRVWDVSGPEAVVLAEWHTGGLTPGAVAALDLDGDGVPATYTTFGHFERKTWRFIAEDDGIGRSLAVTDVSSGSDGYGARAGPQVDGRPTLALALGAWASYEAALYAGDDHGTLERVARRQMGGVDGVIADPHHADGLLAVVGAHRVNPQVFPAGRRHGDPPGLYGLVWTGERLEERWRVPVPGEGWRHPRDLHVAIGPAGGRVLAATDRDGAWLVPLPAEGPPDRDALWFLPDWTALDAVDLDGDGDDELLLSDGRDGGALWALGVGDGPLPARWERPAGADTAAGPGLFEELGMPAAAAAAWRSEALQRGSTSGAVDAWRRAAAQAVEAGDAAAAREAWEALARHPDARDEGIGALAAHYRDRREPERAVAELTRLGAPSAAIREATAEAAAWTRLTTDFTAPLAAPWDVEGPTARRDPVAPALVVQDTAGRGLTARVTARDALTVRARGAIAETTWRGGVRLEVRGPDGASLAWAAVVAQGGGGVVTWGSECQVGASEDYAEHLAERPGAVDLALALHFTPGVGWRCEVADGEGGGLDLAGAAGDLPAGPLTVALVPAHRSMGVSTRMRVDAVTIVGRDVAPAPDLPGAAGRRLLADGLAAEALGLLDAGAAWTVAVAQVRAGERDRARATLAPFRDVLQGPDRNELFAARDPAHARFDSLVLSGEPELLALARAVGGPLRVAEALQLAGEVERGILSGRPDAGALRMGQALAELRRIDGDAARDLELVVRRWRLAEPGRSTPLALEDLRWIDAHCAADDGPQCTGVLEAVADSAVAALLASGSGDEALARASAAVAGSATPDVVRDKLGRWPEVRAVADEPAWREVLGPSVRIWGDVD